MNKQAKLTALLLQCLKEARDAIKSLPDDALGENVIGDGRYHWYIKYELLDNIDAAIARGER